MATDEDYLAVRYVTQYILVPIIFVIGFAGNAVSIIVLTRKRMRCSTNIYLTGLAIADIVYLIMLLIMSAEHYKATQYSLIFWQCRGISQWLIDGSSYISLYIVVCFTIERYIAVCHPMKGQVFCTEERAKRVLTILVIVILLSILSSNFEYQIEENLEFINETTGGKCDFIPILNETDNYLILGQNNLNETTAIAKQLKLSQIIDIPNNQQNSSIFTNETILEATTAAFVISSTSASSTKLISINGCRQVRRYSVIGSKLANNKTYRDIFDIFTILVYSIIPLILIIIFNTFLIRTVQKSKRIRDKMTNMSVRQIKHQQQENKITIILIAVVILFIICQTPWAIYIFLETFTENILTDNNTKRICGNIFNTLVAIDAASNFVLYCLLSDKYRKTLKELLMGYKHKRQSTYLSRQETLTSSWYSNRYKASAKKLSDANETVKERNQNERKSMQSTMMMSMIPNSKSSSDNKSKLNTQISKNTKNTKKSARNSYIAYK